MTTIDRKALERFWDQTLPQVAPTPVEAPVGPPDASLPPWHGKEYIHSTCCYYCGDCEGDTMCTKQDTMGEDEKSS